MAIESIPASIHRHAVARPGARGSQATPRASGSFAPAISAGSIATGCDGVLTIVGRKKDVIIPGGFNVYPVDLEAALLAQPAVAEAAVVGVPSARWGETPVAFVVLAPGHPGDPETLRGLANARLGSTPRIAEVVIVPALPRSPIGKVLKRALRETYGDVARDG